ncbi:unnamed protein product [Closterium sp. NIES-53]
MVSEQGRERYFLLVVDDYTRYTTVFPLRSKGEVLDVLIPWIRAVRLKLRERFRQDLPVLRLHSDRGGEFSSNLLQDFCRGEGILQSFTLPASPQENGIAECCIGLVMEVARTSVIHAAAPHFLWPFAVRYTAHQLSLWPRVSLPETSPTLRWMGEVGDASMFRVWGSHAFVRDTSADKLSTHAIPCVFLGFPPDAPRWQFYHPTSRRVFPSQDVTFDESVPFYHLFPYRSAPPPPPPLFLAPSPPLVAVDLGAARGTASGGAASKGAEPGAESGGAEPAGVESGGAEPRGIASSGGPAGASPRLSPRLEPLSPQQLREWFAQRTRLRSGAAGAGDPTAGDTGAGGAGFTAGAGGARGAAAAGPGGARTRGTGAAGTGSVGGAGAGGAAPGDSAEPGGAGAGGTGAGGAGARGARAGDPGAVGAGAGGTGAGGTSAGGAGAGGAMSSGTGAGGTVRPRRYFVPLLQEVLGLPSSAGLTPPLLCPPPDQINRRSPVDLWHPPALGCLRYVWHLNLRSRDMAFEAFAAWLPLAKRESGVKLKSVQSDEGGEYQAQWFKQYLVERGIKQLISLPYAHQQQGVTERMNKTLHNIIRKLLRGMRLPNNQLPETMDHAVLLHNLFSSSSLPNNASPHLLWTGKSGTTKMLRVFGCMVQYRPHTARAGRFSQRAQWGLHLRIEKHYNAWKIFDVHSKEIVAARDVIFYERLTLRTYLDNFAAERDLTGGFRGNRAFATPADEADWDEQTVDGASKEAEPLPYCSVPVLMDDENPCKSINAEVYYDFTDNGYVTPQPVNTNVSECIGPNFIPDLEAGDEAVYPEDPNLPRYKRS